MKSLLPHSEKTKLSKGFEGREKFGDRNKHLYVSEIENDALHSKSPVNFEHYFPRTVLLLLVTFFVINSAQADVALLCAHPKEFGQFISNFEGEPEVTELGVRKFYKGKLWGVDSVVAVARVGKVASAATVAHLLSNYEIDSLIFIGVAGAVDPKLEQGDICIADRVVQHDMDARPFIDRYVLPFLNVAEISSDPTLSKLALQASPSQNTYHGLIATGDQFISNSAQLRKEWPDLLAVDMESGAIAQVCYENEIPFTIVRIISDNCNGTSMQDCKSFMETTAPAMSKEMIQGMFQQMRSK